MGDVEVFGPIQGTFLCCLSKELALTASQGTEVIHKFFAFTFIFRTVGNSECRVLFFSTRTIYLFYLGSTWHLFTPR